MKLLETLTTATDGDGLDRRSIVQALFGSAVAVALFGTEANIADAKVNKHKSRRRKKNKRKKPGNPANAVGCLNCKVGDTCVNGQCCTPEGTNWCLNDNRKCGGWVDNCGRAIDCGSCPANQFCIEWTGECSVNPPCPTTSCPDGAVCVQGACCTPDPTLTCQARGQQCGYMANNCGQSLYCGSCPTGQVCDFNTLQCVDQYICIQPCGIYCCPEDMLCRAGECDVDINPAPQYAEPSPQGQISDLRPTVSVIMADDVLLPAGAITMQVDGTSRNFSYNLNTGIVSWSPSSNLTSGKHTVKVSTTDDAGKVGVIDWVFSIVAKPDTTPPVISSIDSMVINGKRSKTIEVKASDPESGIYRVEMRFCKIPTSNAKTCWDSGNWLKSPNGYDYDAPYQVFGNFIPDTGTFWVVVKAVNNAGKQTLKMRRFTWTSSGFTPDTGLTD